MKKVFNKILSFLLIGALFFSTSGYYNVEHNCSCDMEEECNDNTSDCCSIYDRVLAEESECEMEHVNHNSQKCEDNCVTTCSYKVDRKIIHPDQLPVKEISKLKPEIQTPVIIHFEEEETAFFSNYHNLFISLVSPKSYGKNLVIKLN